MKLIEALEIVNRANAAGGEAAPFFLACGFTPLHLRTFLQARLQERLPSVRALVEVGLYGDLPGNLERARSGSFKGAAVAVEWPDLDPRLGIRQLGGWSPEVLPDIASSVAAARRRIQNALESLAGACPVALSLPTLAPAPVSHTAGWQAGRYELELRQELDCLAVWAAGQSRVRVLNSERLDRISPPAERFDPKAELQTGFPYRQPHADALASLFAALLANPAPKKGIITDLDDTLWRGILGEAGVEGISWDLARHSQVHGIYQQFLDALAGRGVLVGAASKNDPALVSQAFERDDLRIRRARIFPFEVNWGPKSASVRRILDAWNIAADSVIFIDDSPMELAEVQAVHPDIECLLFPGDDPARLLELLEHLRDRFGKSALSEEDRIRAESIRSAGELRQAESEGGDALERFLSRAEAEVTFRAAGPMDARAFELVNKTNQFNLNGRRYSEADWQAYFQAPGAFLIGVSYRDKFGPLGAIAAVLGRREGPVLKIDAWVMSCRAFARRIEHQTLRRLFEAFDAQEVVLDFAKTPRNGPVQEFLSMFGEPAPGFRLRREALESKCPPLFHTVKEIADE